MKRHAEVFWTTLGVGVAVGFAVAIAVGALAGPDPAPAPPITAPAPASTTSTLVDDPIRRTPMVEAVERVKPSVVSITTEPLTADLFQFRRRTAPASTDGSGVIIDERGVVLTNAHVVARASRITATLADGRSAEASVMGIAPTLDLAVLLLEGLGTLSAVEIGTSDDLMLGEPVIAIGNPFGLGHTVTTGVISAPRRALATDDQIYQDFIQTDASINPGNSGGPLLNIHGQLIGITTSIHEEAQGIGFAIPVDRAVKIARDLTETGQVQIPWLGLTLEDVVLRSRSEAPQAVRVQRVIAEGPAALAGIATGDIIRRIGDRVVVSRADLNTHLSGTASGAAVALVVAGAQGQRTVTVETAAVDVSHARRSLVQVIGGRFAVQGGEERSTVILTGVRPGGALARVGLRAGDVVHAIDGRVIRTVDQLDKAIQRALSRHRPSVLFDVRRGRARGRVPIPI
jgi:serine protease Do